MSLLRKACFIGCFTYFWAGFSANAQFNPVGDCTFYIDEENDSASKISRVMIENGYVPAREIEARFIVESKYYKFGPPIPLVCEGNRNLDVIIWDRQNPIVRPGYLGGKQWNFRMEGPVKCAWVGFSKARSAAIRKLKSALPACRAR